MISYIKGEITEIYDNTIIVEAYGVGYEIMIPTSVLSMLPEWVPPLKYTLFNMLKRTFSIYTDL